MSAYALNLFPDVSECFTSTQRSNGDSARMTKCTRSSPKASEIPPNSLDATISDATVDPQFLPNYFMSAVKSNRKVPTDSVMDSTSVICNKVIFFITVTSHGSSYVVKRTLSQFNDFRNNLLKEWNNEINLPELPHTPWDEDALDSGKIATIKKNTHPSQQTYRLVEHPGHSSFAPTDGSKSTLFGSGFTKIRNMFNGYIPILNSWLMGVCEFWPTSTALGNFLWEPITSPKYHLTTSTSTAAGLCQLESITEGEEDLLDDDSIRSLHSKTISSQLEVEGSGAPRARTLTCSSEISDEDSSVLLIDPYSTNYLAILNHLQSSW